MNDKFKVLLLLLLMTPVGLMYIFNYISADFAVAILQVYFLFAPLAQIRYLWKTKSGNSRWQSILNCLGIGLMGTIVFNIGLKWSGSLMLLSSFQWGVITLLALKFKKN